MQEGSKEHSEYLRSIEELRTVLVKVNKLSRAEVPIVSDDEMMQAQHRKAHFYCFDLGSRSVSNWVWPKACADQY
jgi:hypothetical protein